MDHLRHQKYQNKRFKNKFEIINISINDMDKFEKKRTNKEENIYIWYDCYDWLINYVPEPTQKTVGGV